jgi:hypothetical protein
LLDQLRAEGLRHQAVVADAGYGLSVEFRRGWRSAAKCTWWRYGSGGRVRRGTHLEGGGAIRPEPPVVGDVPHRHATGLIWRC